MDEIALLYERIKDNLRVKAEALGAKLGLASDQVDEIWKDMWDHFKVTARLANAVLHDWIDWGLKDRHRDSRANRREILATVISMFGLDPIWKPKWWDKSLDDLPPDPV
jgi:hypothetical protein